MASYYLNTDLDLMGQQEFDRLMDDLEQSLDVLHYGKAKDRNWYARMEAKHSRDSRIPEDDIRLLLAAIDDLGNDSKATWKKLTKIEFNVGWQASTKRPEGSFAISNDMLRMIHEIGGILVITIYPASENDDEDS